MSKHFLAFKGKRWRQSHYLQSVATKYYSTIVIINVTVTCYAGMFTALAVTQGTLCTISTTARMWSWWPLASELSVWSWCWLLLFCFGNNYSIKAFSNWEQTGHCDYILASKFIVVIAMDSNTTSQNVDKLKRKSDKRNNVIKWKRKSDTSNNIVKLKIKEW